MKGKSDIPGAVAAALIATAIFNVPAAVAAKNEVPTACAAKQEAMLDLCFELDFGIASGVLRAVLPRTGTR